MWKQTFMSSITQKEQKEIHYGGEACDKTFSGLAKYSHHSPVVKRVGILIGLSPTTRKTGLISVHTMISYTATYK